MSNDTWHFSFAKYLELRFHGNAYYRRQMSDVDPPTPTATPTATATLTPTVTPPNTSNTSDSSTLTCACSHPLHTEHFHYFGCRDLVASFKFTPIVLKEMVLSPVSIAISVEEALLPRLMEGIRHVAQCGHGLHAVVAEWLTALIAECQATKLETCVAHLIDQQVSIHHPLFLFFSFLFFSSLLFSSNCADF